ncbi:GNAT family N-acetyltransferase [Candidatus Latescibacterota bacterium]
MENVVGAESTHLLVARCPEGSGPIVGSVALVFYRVTTGLHARIEDLIVSKDIRRQGIGNALMVRALEIAKYANANVVDLTSNPLRIEANSLYKTLGFKKRRTNVYRYILND